MPKIGMEPIRRAEAINAALDCFCDFGIDKTTMDMVAERAGFSKGIVAYYFKSKRQLTIECLKAFLKSYQLKIKSEITKGMTPIEIVRRVVEITLPPVDEENEHKINVSDLDGIVKICLPQEKIAKLFSQFVSKAAIDEEMKAIMKDIYTSDVEGISALMQHAKKKYQMKVIDENEAAYALLTMLYGLSFFRVTGFMPPGKTENREIAFHFVDLLFGI